MFIDPIVEEIHATRAKIAAECDYDLHKITLRVEEFMKLNEGRFKIVTEKEMNQLRHRTNTP